MPSSYVDSYTGAGRQHNTAPPHRSVQHSTVLHSTAQHSTARHNTIQHSTAPCWACRLWLCGGWPRLQQARSQEAPSLWCKLLAMATAVAVAVAVAAVAVVVVCGGAALALSTYPVNSQASGRAAQGARRRWRPGGRRGRPQWQRPSQRVGLWLRLERAQARALLRTGAHCKAASGAGRRWWVQVWSSRQ